MLKRHLLHGPEREIHAERTPPSCSKMKRSMLKRHLPPALGPLRIVRDVAQTCLFLPKNGNNVEETLMLSSRCVKVDKEQKVKNVPVLPREKGENVACYPHFHHGMLRIWSKKTPVYPRIALG